LDVVLFTIKSAQHFWKNWHSEKARGMTEEGKNGPGIGDAPSAPKL